MGVVILTRIAIFNNNGFAYNETSVSSCKLSIKSAMPKIQYNGVTNARQDTRRKNDWKITSRNSKISWQTSGHHNQK